MISAELKSTEAEKQGKVEQHDQTPQNRNHPLKAIDHEHRFPRSSSLIRHIKRWSEQRLTGAEGDEPDIGQVLVGNPYLVFLDAVDFAPRATPWKQRLPIRQLRHGRQALVGRRVRVGESSFSLSVSPFGSFASSSFLGFWRQ
ncbi:hypothetical protein CRG98_039310 [Punica granatum]|uniref:Uncharacterized protein n=1 Tax=Punica granatum TaxID=22663 RepID=A0A2I0I8G1_PUNGR|nr:hypothetical protein CRG98_039310 [Punica granatum]